MDVVQTKGVAAAFRRHERWLWALLLCVSIVVLWASFYRFRSLASLRMPLGYQGDGFLIFGSAKAYMDGDIFPFFSKVVAHLNAPFSGNWNDYPITEDIIYATIGWLGKLVGLFAAANFVLLGAHLLAGLSFWYVCRALKYKPAFAFSLALVYAFSHYILSRGLGHLPLTVFWHVPLLLLVTTWAFSADDFGWRTARFRFAVLLSAVCGMLNPYYTGMFLQFIGFAVLLHLARRQYAQARFAVVLILVTIGAFLLVNLDTIIYGLIHGANTQAAGRDLAALEVYGLKVPELLLPPGQHIIPGYEDFSQKHYYSQAFVKGEQWGPYLGLVPLAGVLLLAGFSIYRLLQGRLAQISTHFWLTIWVLLYSLIGGFNLVLGAFGFVLFRGTNRYSIFILTFGLLFLARLLSRKCPRRLVLPVAAIVIVIGVTESFGEFQDKTNDGRAEAQAVVDAVNADRHFAVMTERQAPGAMVFQLPVAGFPEVAPIHKMGDYEHFRPYLYTKTLHYSYGTNKGRGTEGWQAIVASMKPAAMAAKLESYGFGLIMVNRRGYEDKGDALIAGLVAAGKPVIMENKDLVALRLQPSATPIAIDAWPVFGAGWSSDEGTHRWGTASRASISIRNSSAAPIAYTLSLTLASLVPSKVSVSLGGQEIAAIDIPVASQERPLGPLQVMLQPGDNQLLFESDKAPVSPGNKDPRMLSFRLASFQFYRSGN